MATLKPRDILLVFQLIGFAASNGPPRVTGAASQQITARVGTVIKLPCPVAADPSPIMEWYKDTYHIHKGWDRFKVTSKFLKIQQILPADAGHYMCKAVNGFGSVAINITLRVTDGSEGVKKHNLFPQRTDKDSQKVEVKPWFAFPHKMRRTTIYRPAGSSVRFKCRAQGEPLPQIQWFKDGQPFSTNLPRSPNRNRWTLKLHDVKKENSGKYTCHVFNEGGAVNYTYSLEVIERFKSKPEILPPHPMNITVNYASTASFQCRVKSSVQPHIQWLKLAEEGSFPVNQNATLVFNGHHFVVLETGSVLHTTDGTYLNKLVIPRATEADSGMYICMGANSMGFSFREAFLFVTTDRTRQFVSRSSSQPTGSFSLALVIALPLVMVIVLMAGFGYVIQQRRQCCTNRSPTVQRLPVPTHDKDVYPAVHNPHMYPASHNSSQNKYAKPYSSVDYYTDISSASRSHPSHHQHQHTHYNY